MRRYYTVVLRREGPSRYPIYRDDVLIGFITRHEYPEYLMFVDIFGVLTKYAYYGDLLCERTHSSSDEIYVWQLMFKPYIENLISPGYPNKKIIISDSYKIYSYKYVLYCMRWTRSAYTDCTIIFGN